MSSLARRFMKFASFIASLLSSNHGPTTPSPQTSAVEALQPPRPQDDIESGGGAATTHNQHDALPSTEEIVLPFTRRRELSVLVMFAPFLASLRSIFHGLTTTPVPQTTAAAAPRTVPLPLEGIDSDGSTGPTTHNQCNALPSMEDLAVPVTICVGVYALIPPHELIHSHPLRYSPFLASVCLTVLAATLSLLWHRTPHYHRRRRRSIEVAVVSSVFSCLLRILLLLLPAGKPLIFVAGFFFLVSGFAAIYVLSPPRHPNSLPV